MGTFLSTSRISFANVRPSFTGIITSSNNKSNEPLKKMSLPFFPSSANFVSKPFASKYSCKRGPKLGSSSTNKILVLTVSIIIGVLIVKLKILTKVLIYKQLTFIVK